MIEEIEIVTKLIDNYGLPTVMIIILIAFIYFLLSFMKEYLTEMLNQWKEDRATTTQLFLQEINDMSKDTKEGINLLNESTHRIEIAVEKLCTRFD